MKADSYDTISIPGSNGSDNIAVSVDSDNNFNENLINPPIKLKGILKYPVHSSEENTIKRIVKFCVGFIVCIIILVIVIVFFI